MLDVVLELFWIPSIDCIHLYCFFAHLDTLGIRTTIFIDLSSIYYALFYDALQCTVEFITILSAAVRVRYPDCQKEVKVAFLGHLALHLE